MDGRWHSDLHLWFLRARSRMQGIGVIPCLRCGLRELLHLDRQFVWHPYTSLQPTDSPLPVVGGFRMSSCISPTAASLSMAFRHGGLFCTGIGNRCLMAALQEGDAIVRSCKLFAGVTHPPAVRAWQELLLNSVSRLAASRRVSGDSRAIPLGERQLLNRVGNQGRSAFSFPTTAAPRLKSP